MMNTLQTKAIRLLFQLFLLGILLSFAIGLNYLNAWTAPTQAPPDGNVSAPLNTGTTVQTKSGGLQMSSLDVFGSNGVSVSGGQLSFWPGSTIVLPSYTIDMDALNPGANNGIRFPDGSVQTEAATGGGISVTDSGTLAYTSNVTIASGWDTVTFAGTIWNGSNPRPVSGALRHNGAAVIFTADANTSLENQTLVVGTEKCTLSGANSTCVLLNADGSIRLRTMTTTLQYLVFQ